MNTGNTIFSDYRHGLKVGAAIFGILFGGELLAIWLVGTTELDRWLALCLVLPPPALWVSLAALRYDTVMTTEENGIRGKMARGAAVFSLGASIIFTPVFIFFMIHLIFSE